MCVIGLERVRWIFICIFICWKGLERVYVYLYDLGDYRGRHVRRETPPLANRKGTLYVYCMCIYALKRVSYGGRHLYLRQSLLNVVPLRGARPHTQSQLADVLGGGWVNMGVIG
jgi:hypothetical protein